MSNSGFQTFLSGLHCGLNCCAFWLNLLVMYYVYKVKCQTANCFWFTFAVRLKDFLKAEMLQSTIAKIFAKMKIKLEKYTKRDVP